VKNPLDVAQLKTAIDNVHRAGIPGVFAEVRKGDQVWRGAAGVADVSTDRPATPDMRHRVGSISKTALQHFRGGWRQRHHANPV
jgi:D-alanyl-D-alanine carboxypeptidase